MGYSPWGRKRVGHDFVTKQKQLTGNGYLGVMKIFKWDCDAVCITWTLLRKPLNCIF